MKPDPGSFAKREYGVELTGEDVRQLKEMVAAIQNECPAMYFETKFERPVYLNEFVAAIVPENVSEDVSKSIRESGLQVFVYKPKDESSRNEAVKLASEIKVCGSGLRVGREPSLLPVQQAGRFSFPGMNGWRNSPAMPLPWPANSISP